MFVFLPSSAYFTAEPGICFDYQVVILIIEATGKLKNV
jgi:hypothetical protein